MKSLNNKKTLSIVILFTALFMVVSHDTHAQRTRVTVERNVVHVNRKPAVVPRRGTTVAVAPTRARVITYRSIPYRYYGGVFYKPVNGRYVVVAPPVGIRINVLPAGYRTLIIRGTTYYYFGGIYYVLSGNEYKVVATPEGALVENLPKGHEKVVIDGETYYVANDTQYKAVIYKGEVWYEVIKVG